MKKTGICTCCLSLLLAIHAHDMHAFSFRRCICSGTIKVLQRLGIVLAKTCVAAYWNSYLESHGYDDVSRREGARRAGACSIGMPSEIQQDVPIAPSTVPELVQQRIGMLSAGNFAWPACGHLLLVGVPGMGKSQLARYIAKQSRCHFLYASAAGFMSSKENAGVETVATLFKQSRIRSEWNAWMLRLRQMIAFLLRRPIPQKKPTVVLIDEIDAIARPSRGEVHEGDQLLEIERGKTLKRLYWELAYNRYAPEAMLRLVNECPPANFFERVLALRFKYLWGFRGSLGEILAMSKKANSYIWKYFCGIPKAEALVVATTNVPVESLDPATRIFFDVIEFDQLTSEHHRAIVEFYAQKKKFQTPDLLDQIVERTRDVSPDTIAAIVNDAALFAAGRAEQPGSVVISQDDINRAFTMLPN
ncbi:MAG TPA: ATP-binding protein [Candidatus Dependentiae bacterium]|nr:ATP-binding protein [Candidatus Dependentiae bacterium]